MQQNIYIFIIFYLIANLFNNKIFLISKDKKAFLVFCFDIL